MNRCAGLYFLFLAFFEIQKLETIELFGWWLIRHASMKEEVPCDFTSDWNWDESWIFHQRVFSVRASILGPSVVLFHSYFLCTRLYGILLPVTFQRIIPFISQLLFPLWTQESSSHIMLSCQMNLSCIFLNLSESLWVFPNLSESLRIFRNLSESS